MESINNILKDYLNFIDPSKLKTDKTKYIEEKKVDTSRDKKINILINQITGDGNLNTNKKIIGVKAKISDDVSEKDTDKSYYKPTIHQFYSPSSEF
jgi:hypothetical protein